jgi:hypothetical protein
VLKNVERVCCFALETLERVLSRTKEKEGVINTISSEAGAWRHYELNMKGHRDTAARRQVAMQRHGECDLTDWRTDSCHYGEIFD